MGKLENRDIEQFFFGRIDTKGRKAAEYFAEFEHPDADKKVVLGPDELHECPEASDAKRYRLTRAAVASGTQKHKTLLYIQEYQNLFCALQSVRGRSPTPHRRA